MAGKVTGERLGEILVRKGLIRAEQLDQAVQCQVIFGGRLGTNLLELGHVQEDELNEVLAQKCQVPAVSHVRADISSRSISMFLRPRRLMSMYTSHVAGSAWRRLRAADSMLSMTSCWMGVNPTSELVSNRIATRKPFRSGRRNPS